MNPIGFAVAAALGNVAGALAVVRHERRSLRFIDACLAFGAGFMLAVAVLGVMPEVLRDGPGEALFVLLGYLAVHLAQHVLTPHFHFGEETHRVSPGTGISALFGLTLHTFFDGVAIASGFLVSGQLGILLFLAVLLHKLPEGVTIASVMVAGGQSRGRAIGAAAVLGGATVLGVLLDGTGRRAGTARPRDLRRRDTLRGRLQPRAGVPVQARLAHGGGLLRRGGGILAAERMLAGWVR